MAQGTGNAVFVTMDITRPKQSQRMFRGIVVNDMHGQPVKGKEHGNVASCKHEDIEYLARFRMNYKIQNPLTTVLVFPYSPWL